MPYPWNISVTIVIYYDNDALYIVTHHDVPYPWNISVTMVIYYDNDALYEGVGGIFVARDRYV